MEPRNQNICIYIIFIYIGCLYCQESSTEEPETTSTEAPILIKYEKEKEKKFLYYLWGLIVANLFAASTLTLVSTSMIQKLICSKKRTKRENKEVGQQVWNPGMAEKTKINENPTKMEPESKDKTVDNEKAKPMKTEDEGENPTTGQEKTLVPSEKAKKKSAEKEYQYQNNGPIKFETQNAVASDFADEVKETPKNPIKQVKWAPEPFVFYEIGPGVDQIEMNEKIPSSASDIMTASLKQVEPKVK